MTRFYLVSFTFAYFLLITSISIAADFQFQGRIKCNNVFHGTATFDVELRSGGTENFSAECSLGQTSTIKGKINRFVKRVRVGILVFDTKGVPSRERSVLGNRAGSAFAAGANGGSVLADYRLRR